MFVDSHCHLSSNALLPQIDAVLQKMHEAQVARALCVSTSLPDFEQVEQLIDTYPQLWGSVGVHPNEDKEVMLTTKDLVGRSQHPKVIAIGETGLDYYRQQGTSAQDLGWQHERFQRHIDAAIETGLPLIIHTRQSAQDTLATLREAVSKPGELRGVFHCFTEDVAVAKEVLDLGFYISFSGILTFNSAKELKEVAKMVPKDACLIETDSPYLAPVPYRGKTNTPAYVPYVAETLANLWQVSIEEVGLKTSFNFDDLFKKCL